MPPFSHILHAGLLTQVKVLIKFDHLELHKLGIRKGSAPVTDERIVSGVAAGK